MPGTAPKYSMIADQILRDINAGRFAVGELIPTETDLMRAHAVSRHTVRSAINMLKSSGVLSSRQGQGSRVVSDGSKSSFVENIQSIDELVTFAKHTRKKLISSAQIEADADLAQYIQCEPGRRLLEIRLLRTTQDAPAKPVALVNLWMDVLFEPAVAAIASEQRAAAQILKDQFGYDFAAVTQTVSASLLGPADAQILGRPVGQPSLLIERNYAARRGETPHLWARSLSASPEKQIVSHFERSPVTR